MSSFDRTLSQYRRACSVRRRMAARLERRADVCSADAMGVFRDRLFLSLHDAHATAIDGPTRRLLLRCGFRSVTFENLETERLA